MIDIIKSKEKVNGYRISKIVNTNAHTIKYSVAHRCFNNAADAIEYAKSLAVGKDK